MAGVRGGLLSFVERSYYDSWHRLAGQRRLVQHVVLAVIDEPSLSMTNDPLIFWTPHMARAIGAMRRAGAKVVGLDLLFSVSPETWLKEHGSESSQYDVPFRTELASGQVVMVGSRIATKAGHDDFLLPSPDYLLALPDFDFEGHIGLSDLVSDMDGAVRQYAIKPAMNLLPGSEGASLPRIAFASLLAARAAGQDLQAPSWTIGGRGIQTDATPVRIPYAGPPGTFPRISIGRLFSGDALNEAEMPDLKDKVVIIGGEYLGSNDYHQTPYSSGFIGGAGQFMSGPEIHANIVEALLSGWRIRELGPSVQMAVGATLFLLAGLCFLSLPLKVNVGVLVGTLVLVAATSYGAFLRDVWLPVAQYHLGLLVCFFAALGFRLATGERERAHMRQMFGRYVSDQVVDILLKSGHQVELGGVKQNITVLFSDIRNFTTISERLDPQDVVEMLNTYFERACKPILDEGGTIDKFIGDAVMVQFGAPMPYADHATRAVRAALAMARIATEFEVWMKGRFPDKGLPDFHIGVGLHSGPAVIGNIGSSWRMEYTAIGDTVNTASRIEGKTKELGCVILASRETVDAVGSAVLTGKTSTVSVKGRAAAVELFEITGFLDETE